MDLGVIVGVQINEARRDDAAVGVQNASGRGAVDTAEYDRPTTKTEAQAKLALAARAVGNQIVPPSEGGHGHAIVGGGPGTLTFRLPANQRVRAQGIWSAGR